MSEQIFTPGPQAVPLTYTVPGTGEVIPLACQAVFDGSGASGDFVPALIFKSQAGHVIARVPTSETVVAGSSAEVTWAPFLDGRASGSGAKTLIAWGALEPLPAGLTQDFPPSPDPAFAAPFSFTSHKLVEDGSGTFSFDPATPTVLICNTVADNQVIVVRGTFSHTQGNDGVPDSDVNGQLLWDTAPYTNLSPILPAGIAGWGQSGLLSRTTEATNGGGFVTCHFEMIELALGGLLPPFGFAVYIDNETTTANTLTAGAVRLWAGLMQGG